MSQWPLAKAALAAAARVTQKAFLVPSEASHSLQIPLGFIDNPLSTCAV